MEDMFAQLMKSQQERKADLLKGQNEMRKDISNANQMLSSHAALIKQLEQQVNQLSVSEN